MRTTTVSITINHLGFKQYVDVLDEYVCPQCDLQYTNEGEGVLCKSCHEKNEAEDANDPDQR
jgi:hypothetical protein